MATDGAFRTGEVATGTIAAYDIADAWATVEHGKGDRTRRVPMSRLVVAKMETYLRRYRPILAATEPQDVRADDPLIVSSQTGGRLTLNSIYQAMSRAYARGGGKGRFGLHRLRHLFGTSAAEGGMHPLVRQLITGHAGEKSQRVYQHPSDEVVQREHAKITPLRRLAPSRRRRLA